MVDANQSTDTCELKNYGIKQDVVDSLFKSIVWWLEGRDLPWTQTKYVNVFKGPLDRVVVELLFFHYDGPPETEVGGGGEYNHCKMYLYDDHVSVMFTGESIPNNCGLTFKYSTKWTSTDSGLLGFIHGYLNDFLNKIFEADPTRFSGTDLEVETVKHVVSLIDGVLKGDVLA